MHKIYFLSMQCIWRHLADQYWTNLMDFWRLEISANRVWRKKRTNYTHALISRFTVWKHLCKKNFFFWKKKIHRNLLFLLWKTTPLKCFQIQPFMAPFGDRPKAKLPLVFTWIPKVIWVSRQQTICDFHAWKWRKLFFMENWAVYYSTHGFPIRETLWATCSLSFSISKLLSKVS